ncbi:MAG TPA: glycerophosphodiester phosphodiesterase [Rhodospirillales bacterium]|nr:glycerophosphodiester phosphodiesterase [Rhodospirillales bacterium]
MTAATAATAATAVSAVELSLPCTEDDRPLVVAHRGASGYRPEHTLAAYALAIEMGADFVEPDLVMTSDGVPVARHENELGSTTDVAEKPEFARRRTTKTIDGRSVDGWFSEDFTFAELRTLRARERIPQLRPDNRRFDGLFPVPSFAEILALVDGANVRFQLAAEAAGATARRCIGVYPETKHPSYFRRIGLAMELPLLQLLNRDTATGANRRVFIQSFEVGNLKLLRGWTTLPLVQLLAGDEAPWDRVAAGDMRTGSDLATPQGLAAIAGYADAIGVDKAMLIPRRGAGGMLGPPSPLIADAHAAGLRVHGWTFRAENAFLPPEFRRRGGEAACGDLDGEITAFLAQGMDGFFTDQPDIGARVRDAFSR